MAAVEKKNQLTEPKSESSANLLDTLRDLMDWFQIEKVNGVIIGGIAASLLGRPRTTGDVDVLILLEEVHWKTFLNQGKKYNFFPRISEPLKFARQSRILLLKHKPSAIDLYISFAVLPFEKKTIFNATTIEVKGLRICLPKPEDLIIMKAVAARPKDLIDIESIFSINPKLNYRRILKTVQEFANAIDMPDIIDNLEKIHEKSKKILR